MSLSSYVHSTANIPTLNHNYFYEGFHFHHVFFLDHKIYLLFYFNNFIFNLFFQTQLRIQFLKSIARLLKSRVSDYIVPVENYLINYENFVRNYMQFFYFGRVLENYHWNLSVVDLIRLATD